MGVEAPTLVRLLDRLSAEGFILGQPFPGDRRANTLHLSDCAHEILKELNEVAATRRRRLLDGIPAERLVDCPMALEAIRQRPTKGSVSERSTCCPRWSADRPACWDSENAFVAIALVVAVSVIPALLIDNRRPDAIVTGSTRALVHSWRLPLKKLPRTMTWSENQCAP